MARTGTVHHLRIDLSDVDRGVYDALDLRVAQHPSETTRHVLAKTIAYALSLAPNIAFTRAEMCEGVAPEIEIRDEMGIATWIDVGDPAADRLKRATNAARRVVVFTVGDGEALVARARELSRAARIEVYALEPAFVDALSASVAQAGGRFALVRSGGHLYATCAGKTLEAPITTLTVAE